MNEIPHVILVDSEYVRNMQVCIEPNDTEDFHNEDNWCDFSGSIFIGVHKGPVSEDELIAIATMLSLHQNSLIVKPITKLIEF